MTYINEIIELIKDMSGGRSEYEVFSDWVHSSAIAIQNASCILHDKVWHSREAEYKQIMERYSKNHFPDMFGLLCLELGENIHDALGEIYMSGGMGAKSTGQFFTPFHLSDLTAAVGFDPNTYNGEIVRMNEPSIGGGGMVLAVAKRMHEVGVNYQKKLQVVGQDLDWKGVYMSYVQISMLGIDGVIVQGDTLADPYRKGFPKERTFRTPRNMGVLL